MNWKKLYNDFYKKVKELIQLFGIFFCSENFFLNKNWTNIFITIESNDSGHWNNPIIERKQDAFKMENWNKKKKSLL